MTDKKKDGGAWEGLIERRKYIRIVDGSRLTYLTPGGVSGEGKLVDLSLRGLRFLSDGSLSPGDNVRLIFILGNGISLDLAGAVRHANPARKSKKFVYGVEFFIQDYRDLKEHLKLNSYIMRARAEQDQIVQKKLLKGRHV